ATAAAATPRPRSCRPRRSRPPRSSTRPASTPSPSARPRTPARSRRRRTRRRRSWGTPSVTPGGAGWTRVVSPGGRTVASPVLVEDHLRRRRREGGAEPEEFGGLAFHCCEEGRCAVRAASSALMAYSQGQLNPVLP